MFIIAKTNGFPSRTGTKTLITHGKRLFTSGVLHIDEEVQEALHSGKPVVALESAIISHGMPYPANLQTAQAVEKLVRENNATPATVAVLHGRIHVGLRQSELEYLADEQTDSVKVSRRDYPHVLSKRLNGGTTVSGTLIAAHRAGIPIFVTGGIGGVHRGAETTMDVSADLTELGRTPVTVVSAGVKSILDIAKTLEYLETEGVSVSTFGETDDFPAFFTPRSGFKSPSLVRTAVEAASLIYSIQQLNLGSGSLIAVPIPEEFASSGETIEAAIQQAIHEAEETGIMGKDVTPYILRRVNELTEGLSLQANIALVKNNATIGSRIAYELSKLRQEGRNQPVENLVASPRILRNGPMRIGVPKRSGRPVVVGGVVVDFVSKIHSTEFQPDGATYPGRVHQSFGGVGRNLADCMTRLGQDAFLVSAVGDDPQAEAFFSNSKHMIFNKNTEFADGTPPQLDTSGIEILPGETTATYSAILRSTGELVFGVGDMAIHQKVTPQLISKFEEELFTAAIVCVDGNISPESIEHVTELCHYHTIPVWFEPTDMNKAVKPFRSSSGQRLTYISPNMNELRHMYVAMTDKPLPGTTTTESVPGSEQLSLRLEEVRKLCAEVTEQIPVVLVTLGKDGVLLCHRLADDRRPPIKGRVLQMQDKMSCLHFPASSPDKTVPKILSVSGAGDCLVSALIDGMLRGHDLDLCIKVGLLAAQYSLQSYHAVPPSLRPEDFTGDKVRVWAPWSSTILH